MVLDRGFPSYFASSAPSGIPRPTSTTPPDGATVPTLPSIPRRIHAVTCNRAPRRPHTPPSSHLEPIDQRNPQSSSDSLLCSLQNQQFPIEALTAQLRARDEVLTTLIKLWKNASS
eukprot:gb/GEZJ01006210.1/.p1 GENE.gb/GEZJ01006210.1/~~gb/GEZJ01006210.1/.p1  ORF type:complete len:116 (-),score=1.92 gb/GEZJ01006210.1/:76-423(-)